jgi:TPR repeat protein
MRGRVALSLVLTLVGSSWAADEQKGPAKPGAPPAASATPAAKPVAAKPGAAPAKKEAPAVVLQRACDAKDIQACFDLARLHWDGKVNGWSDNAKAWEALRRGVAVDKQKAIDLNQKACDNGEATGCLNLGLMYEAGEGVGADKSKAALLYQAALAAATAVQATTRFRLANGYASGDGVAPDDAKAVQLYQKACEAGHAGACLNLGNSYFNGKGVAHDEDRAVPFYEKACDGGYAGACQNLAFLYASGRSVAQDEAKAVQLYQKACDGGVQTACSNVARSYVDGKGVAQDTAKAVQLYQKACDGGVAAACLSLASLYDSGTGVTQDAAKAAQFHQKACEGGVVEGCNGYAQANETACAAGELKGCTRLADFLVRPGFPKQYADPIRALQLYLKACDGDEQAACVALGRLFARGSWVIKDLTRAAALLKKGCDAGDQVACTERVPVAAEAEKGPAPRVSLRTGAEGTVRGVLTLPDGSPAREVGLALCAVGPPQAQAQPATSLRPALRGKGGRDLGFLWVAGDQRAVTVTTTAVWPIATDATGAFRFEAVAEGDYAISPVIVGEVLGFATCRVGVEDADGLPRRVVVKSGQETDAGSVSLTVRLPVRSGP